MKAQEYWITIDSGTTNSRMVLWGDGNKKERCVIKNVGVRNTAIDGNNLRLKEVIKEGLYELTARLPEGFKQIRCILASGMITSNGGLHEVPHILAPAGVEKLAESVQEVLIEEICPIPICFIPGIKNNVENINLQSIEQMDIMRGEEVEALALIEKLQIKTSMLLILPGSHTKIVSVNSNGEIMGCLTSITGELLNSVTKHTVIADSVSREFVSIENYDREMAVAGYKNAEKNGLGRACFSCRILSQFYTKEKEKLESYLLGACFQNDIQAMKNSDALSLDGDTTVVVAGKSVQQRVLIDLIKESKSFKEIIAYEDNEEEMSLSAYGAYIIAKKRMGLNKT